MGGYFYTTKQGDMWDYIAYMVYGDEYKVPMLYHANPKYLDVYMFESGIKIWCPEISESVAADEDISEIPEWRDDENIEDEDAMPTESEEEDEEE